MIEHDGIAVDDLAGMGDEEGAVSVAVESDAEVGAVLEYFLAGGCRGAESRNRD